MTQERIQTRYKLAGPFATQAELEQAIARAIEHHKQDFFPLPPRPVRSWARMICSRSLATEAVFFFSPKSREIRDMPLTSRRTCV